MQDLDLIELEAFLGPLFYTAVFNSNHENVNFLFVTDGSGSVVFTCVVSLKKYFFLLVCLRFDNKISICIYIYIYAKFLMAEFCPRMKKVV